MPPRTDPSRSHRADVVGDVDVRRYARALDARDGRFDGLFFVGITTTRIYCRSVCPSRVSDNSRRRFFTSAAAAERAGFRPCLRCRPELAPGRAVIDAVPRLADAAARRIAAGGLNGRRVADLAREFGVSARHLRRALERAIGVSPVELAQTHRLLLAKRLLADTTLSVTQIAYASGFQSLRRFNTTFREQYRMPPTAVRRPSHVGGKVDARSPAATGGLLRLALTYRPPFAWDVLLACLRRDAIAGVDLVDGRRYGRTVHVAGRSGVVFAEAPAPVRAGPCDDPHLQVDVSPSLVPVLMPLLARLRQLFDLDAEPAAIDAHLAQGGLGAFVRERPGVRILGAMDGFEIVVRTLLRGRQGAGRPGDIADAVTHALGEPLDTGIAALSRTPPGAARIVIAGTIRLEPGSDVAATCRALADVAGLSERMVTAIVVRALSWPDALAASDPALQRSAGATSVCALRTQAEAWRPWRAYAALHLRLHDDERSDDRAADHAHASSSRSAPTGAAVARHRRAAYSMSNANES